MKRRLLLVEDDENIAAALRDVLEAEGYALTHADRGERGLELATRERFDVVLSDLKMPGMTGLELVQRVHEARPQLPLILMTAHGTAETAITATKNGAYDYLLKPFEMDELLGVLEKAIESSRLATQPISIGEGEASLDAIIGQSRAMQEIYKEIGRIAAKPVSVLIRGATGTGKELIARAIYQHSDRAGRPFIAVNCTAIPENLIESELFGHEKGAFTGAESRRIGRLEQAHTGTILLDEIGDMPLPAQVKLLRFLQERTIERVGGRETIPIDVRVLASTHRDLEAAIATQQFREDLFFRLNVVTITLPLVAPARRRHPQPRAIFPAPLRPGVWAGGRFHSARGVALPRRAALAGQCAGAGERGAQGAPFRPRIWSRDLRSARRLRCRAPFPGGRAALRPIHRGPARGGQPGRVAKFARDGPGGCGEGVARAGDQTGGWKSGEGGAVAGDFATDAAGEVDGLWVASGADEGGGVRVLVSGFWFKVSGFLERGRDLVEAFGGMADAEVCLGGEIMIRGGGALERAVAFGGWFCGGWPGR